MMTPAPLRRVLLLILLTGIAASTACHEDDAGKPSAAQPSELAELSAKSEIWATRAEMIFQRRQAAD